MLKGSELYLAFIASPSAQETVEMFEICQMLESLAMHKLVDKPDLIDFAALRALAGCEWDAQQTVQVTHRHTGVLGHAGRTKRGIAQAPAI